jgi:WD40 repeat protein
VVFGDGKARVSTLAVSGNTELAGFDPCGPGAQDAFYLNRGITVHEDLLTILMSCDDDFDEDGPSEAIYTFSRVTGELLSTQNVWGQRFAATDSNIAAVQTWRQEPDGSFVVGELTIVDLRTGEHIETLPDLCGWDGFAFLTVPAIECVTDADVGVENTDLVISPDGNIVAIGSWEWPGEAFTWNRTTGAFAELGLDLRVLAFSPDGSRLAGAQPLDLEDRLEGALLLYSTNDFTLLAEQPTVDDPFSRNGIDFTPDGSSIVGITESGAVRFHDARTLEETRLFTPHEIRARDIDFSLDGLRMATVGLDGFARVWDLETLTLLHEIEVGGLPTAVAFAEDDTQLVVVTRAGGVRIFNLDLDNILDVARDRLRRGFTEDECRVYFPDGDCPTMQEVLAG